MVEEDRMKQISDQLEIQKLLTRYCTAIDTKQYDMLDSVFTPDAVIDYTSAGGPRGPFPEVKEWLKTVLAIFPMTQHVVGNFDITIDGYTANSRCTFFNPMGLGREDGTLQMFFVGGYYNDKLTRTSEGWRISERVEEGSWNYGDFPAQK